MYKYIICVHEIILLPKICSLLLLSLLLTLTLSTHVYLYIISATEENHMQMILIEIKKNQRTTFLIVQFFLCG